MLQPFATLRPGQLLAFLGKNGYGVGGSLPSRSAPQLVAVLRERQQRPELMLGHPQLLRALFGDRNSPMPTLSQNAYGAEDPMRVILCGACLRQARRHGTSPSPLGAVARGFSRRVDHDTSTSAIAPACRATDHRRNERRRNFPADG